MKKTILILLVSVLALSFNACSSDDDNGVDPADKEIKVTVKSLINKDDKLVADVGATIYFFDGLSINDGGEWKYNQGGSFRSDKWERNFNYTHKLTMNETSVSVSNIKGFDQKRYFTVVIESPSDQSSETRYFVKTTFDIKNADYNLKYVFGQQNVEIEY